jgi:hypothetical protein
MLVVIATITNLEIYQRDVKIAFLNGDLDKEVYMKQLEGFVFNGNEKKSLYACQIIIWFEIST